MKRFKLNQITTCLLFKPKSKTFKNNKLRSRSSNYSPRFKLWAQKKHILTSKTPKTKQKTEVADAIASYPGVFVSDLKKKKKGDGIQSKCIVRSAENGIYSNAMQCLFWKERKKERKTESLFWLCHLWTWGFQLSNIFLYIFGEMEQKPVHLPQSFQSLNSLTHCLCSMIMRVKRRGVLATTNQSSNYVVYFKEVLKLTITAVLPSN